MQTDSPPLNATASDQLTAPSMLDLLARWQAPQFLAPLTEAVPILLGFTSLASVAIQHRVLSLEAISILLLCALPVSLGLGHAARRSRLVLLPGGVSLVAAAVNSTVHGQVTSAVVILCLLLWLGMTHLAHKASPRVAAP